jgi:NTP pyrophosphatase (non-canonical NTP hydrolase)
MDDKWEALDQLQDQILKWQNLNFPNCQEWQLALGVCEESGELAACVLKMSRSMRTAEFDEDRLKDAVGDILIFLIGVCGGRGWQLSEILQNTSETVLARNWRNETDSA